MLKFRVNKRGLFQYILIYLMLLDIGSIAVSVIGSNLYYGVMLLLGGGTCLILKDSKRLRECCKLKFQLFFLILLFLMGMTFLITLGSLNYTIILSIIARILLVLAAVAICREQFTTRFVKIILILAVISDVIFLGYYLFGTEFWSPITSHLYHYRRESLSLGDTYGLFLLCFNYFDPTRNSYIFGEPGEYQLVLSVTLFILMNIKTNLSRKEQKWYLIILIATLITTQSTTGYFNLIILLLGALFNRKKNLEIKMIKRTIVFVNIVIVIMLVFFNSEGSFIDKVLISKLINDQGSVDLSQNTGAARWNGFIRLFEYAKQNPFDIILGIGFKNRLLTDVTSCNGFANNVLDFGLLTMMWFVYSFVSALYRYTRHNIVETIVAMFIIMNTWFSQPVQLYTLTVLIAFLPMFLYEKGKRLDWRYDNENKRILL